MILTFQITSTLHSFVYFHLNGYSPDLFTSQVSNPHKEFSVGMLYTLNSKLNLYGVQIYNFNISYVKLPPVLQSHMEGTTYFKKICACITSLLYVLVIGIPFSALHLCGRWWIYLKLNIFLTTKLQGMGGWVTITALN